MTNHSPLEPNFLKYNMKLKAYQSGISEVVKQF